MGLNPASPLARLMTSPVRTGVVLWIGVRPVRRAGLVALTEVALDPQDGLAGDHYRSARATRQVTVIAREQVAAIASFLGLDVLAPERLRRNIVVGGINPVAWRDRRFMLGSALLETTGQCHPCSRMEAEFGAGGYNAVRGHGGITARIVRAGSVRLGDAVRVCEDASAVG